MQRVIKIKGRYQFWSVFHDRWSFVVNGKHGLEVVTVRSEHYEVAIQLLEELLQGTIDETRYTQERG